MSQNFGRAKLLWCLLVGTAHSHALESEMPCPEIGDLRPEPPVLFIHSARTEAVQRALLADISSRNSWIELEYSNKGLRLYNRMPGLGLPITAFHVRVEVFDFEGRPVPELSRDFPATGACDTLSLFPGTSSGFLILPKAVPEAVEGYRTQIKVWASEL